MFSTNPVNNASNTIKVPAKNDSYTIKVDYCKYKENDDITACIILVTMRNKL